MARRRSSGLVGTWAETQRRQQRQREAEQRRQHAAAVDYERSRRAAIRGQVRDERERRRLYDDDREIEAQQRTGAIDQRIRELDSVLETGLRSATPDLQRLKMVLAVPPFDPGVYGHQTVMPDPNRYVPPAPTGLKAHTSSGRKEHEANTVAARAAFERDWYAAQQAETVRQQNLSDYYNRYLVWVEDETQRVNANNAEIDDLVGRLGRGEPAAIGEFVSAILYSSPNWPDDFPRDLQLAFDPDAWQLVVSWEMPGPTAVPPIDRVRYVKSSQRDLEHQRTAAEVRDRYRSLLARCTLRVLHEIFQADPYGFVRSVVFNGLVTGPDPATGHVANRCVLTCTADRQTFASINLREVDPIRCVEGLRGTISPKADLLQPVRPIRTPDSVAGPVVGQSEDGDLNLTTMDPVEFEELVAQLFKAMGFQVMTTARTGDGGIDVLATDFDPVRGGRMVIQVKRYSATVNPTAVRDLFGTVQHEGAIKGILVTTSGFGPGSREFAEDRKSVV